MNPHEYVLSTQRFNLVRITMSHVSDAYLSWLSDSHAYSKYISACSQGYSLSDLQDYVRRKCARDDIVFLAIETKEGKHIGNIKYDPVDATLNTAEMGILIGEQSWMGLGVAREVIQASSQWLSQNLKISKITLGVHPENLNAYSAYKTIGFCEILRTEAIVRMELEI